MNFRELNLHATILKAIEECGYIEPTPIQSQAIPPILKGSDIIASAQTGTGKTAAYILPCLHRLLSPAPIKGSGPRILILVPTRELAMQVAAEATRYSKYISKVKTVCLYGGAPFPFQNRELSRPYEILVATPGRLIDHLERGRVNFSRLEVLILDEADRMLDMGFIEPVEKIALMTPQKRQTLLFSATMDQSIHNLSKKLMHHPIEISVQRSHAQNEHIEQRLYYTNNLEHKNRLLKHFLADPAITQTIVFTATKRHADQLAGELIDWGFSAAALHGDMNQRQRSRTVFRFREKNLRILVATDVAARGLDIPLISHVVNFDLPSNVEDFVHRTGRTGRAGSSGIALSLANIKEKALVKRIETYTGQAIATHIVPGLEPSLKDEKKNKSRDPGLKAQNGKLGKVSRSTQASDLKDRPLRTGFSRKKREGKRSFPKNLH
jgi:superfamily II DNA/RNA helicase